ncbi:hypothetical protein [Sphingomonas sp.]|uniref:hypothetical protein n=1 Tax=Sphingomonas sp. TaxID=28214 RepID=UPI0035A9206D
MTGGSQQLRVYRRERKAGSTVATACVLSGISMGEARLIEAEDAKNPPPPEALELLKTTAPVGAPPEGNDDMGRAKKAPVEQVEQIHAPDFGKAVRIYREDIKPAQSKVGEFSQQMSTAYKSLKKDCHIQPQAAKLAFKLDTMEPDKRDDFLRSFKGLLTALNIYMPVDLVDQAEGKGDAKESVIPIGERQRPKLATVPYQGDDTDLNPDDASAAEAQQAAE